MRSIRELQQQAVSAFYWQSMEPEGRATRFLDDYERALIEDLEELKAANVPEDEIERYNDKFVEKVSGILLSNSRCASVMVTGSSNFNFERNRKRNEAALRKENDFDVWRNKVTKSLVKSHMQVDENASVTETLEYVRHMVERNTWYTNPYIKNYLERKAANGDVEAVDAAINLLKEYEEQGKPVFTKRSGVWKLPELAEKKAESKRQISGMQNMVIEHECCNIIVDFAEERLKLVFDGKPEYRKIQELKHNAFKWSPSNKAWQRKLTSAAARAVDSMGYHDNLAEAIRTYIKENKQCAQKAMI